MATNPFTGQSQSTPKSRFWNRFRSGPKPTPRRNRGTSETTTPVTTPVTPPPPSSPSSPLSLPDRTHVAAKKTSLTHSLTHSLTQSCDNVFSSYNFVTDEMTLPEFAQCFQNNLPQQVVVTHGVYWRENMEINISSSERLNIHFIRHRESVKIKELGTNTEYSVPVTSTLEFGPVYNPYNRNIKDALRGFFYPTVCDIIKIVENAPLPKLIRATSDSSGITPGDLVSKGELLLIKEVVGTKQSGNRELLVTSLTTKTNKRLHENCRGNFTTRPEAIKLSLFSIIKHIPNALPLSVMIFPGDSFDQGDMYYPSHLFQKVIQLSCTFTDVILVASSVPEDSVCDGREPFEIPQEVELELRVVELGDRDRRQLKEKSDEIMRKIQGEYIKQYRNAHQAQAEYVVQEMFLKAVGGLGEEKKSPVAPPRKKKPESLQVAENDDDYPNVTPVHEGLLSRLGKLEDAVWKMKKSQTRRQSQTQETEEEGEEGAGKETASVVRGLEEKMREREGKVEEVETTVSELRSLLEQQQRQIQEELVKMSVELVALREEVKEGKREQEFSVVHQSEISHRQQELQGSSEIAEKNRDIVSTLTATQVVQLLAEVGVEDLHLVSQESITGDILVELNEEELETELGIKKKIHRLKVMKIINGSNPVTDYLKMPEPNSMDIVC